MAFSDDLLLGGRVRIRQPAQGFRVAVDTVLLAAAIPAKSGQRALDLGCGVGGVSLCLLARVPDLFVMGIEADPETAALAQANGATNGHDADRFQARCAEVGALDDLPTDFDHVLMNPPFHDPTSTPSPHAKRSGATHGGEDLERWVEAAFRHLRARGQLTLIWPAARLSLAMAALSRRFGGLRLAPIWPRQGASAKRVLITATKGGKGPEAVTAGLVLHGAGNGYTDAAQAILRDAAALDWKDGARGGA